MARKSRSWLANETVIFWLTTLVLCVVGGAVGYTAGRNFVGKYLAGETTSVNATEPLAPEPVSPEVARKALAPQVIVLDREPTEAERLAYGLDETPEQASQSAEEEGQPSAGAAEEQEGQEDQQSQQASSTTEQSSASSSEPPGASAGTSQPSAEGLPSETSSGSSSSTVSSGVSEQPGGSPSNAPGWIATAGSYKDAVNAQQVVSNLASKGINARIVDVTVHGEQYHRVIVGPFGDKSQAAEASSTIRSAGYPSQVMRQK